MGFRYNTSASDIVKQYFSIPRTLKQTAKEIVNGSDIRFLAARINLAVISFLVSTLYWRRKPNRNYAIAMIVGGTLVYVVIHLMMQTEIGLGLGVGFGIFAIFSLLRFRTVEISLRDMTYLFAALTLC